MVSISGYSLTQLEYVLAVRKFGHFGKAANHCNVTQPTLSMQIQKLEESLGVALFDRSKKPVLLTDAGSRLIGQMQAILFEAQKMNSMIKDAQTSKEHGHLTLGVIPTIAPYVLPRLLPTLKNNHPHLRLKILELQTEQIVDALGNDEIDVGLLATPLKLVQLFEHALFYEPFWVLCHRESELASRKRVSYESLPKHGVWLLTEGHCLRNQIVDICDLKKTKTKDMDFVFESGSLETLKNIVDGFSGYTLLPELATQNIGRNSRLLEFDRPIPAREVGLVYQRKNYKIDLIELLAESILMSLPERLKKLRPKDLDVVPV
jgi:LysR family hydrogen peroxide-inducible transcriptional activator